jgi:hypothetical protein
MKQGMLLWLILVGLSSHILAQHYPNNKYKSEFSCFPIVFYRDSLQRQALYEQSNLLYAKNQPEDYYQKAVNYAKMNRPDSACFYLYSYISCSGDDRLILIDEAFTNLKTDTSLWNSLVRRIEQAYLLSLSDTMIDKEIALKYFYFSIDYNKYEFYSSLLGLPDSLFDIVPFRGCQVAFLKYDARMNLVIPKIKTNQEKFRNILQRYGFPIASKAGYFAETVACCMLNDMMISKDYYDTVNMQYQTNQFDPIAYAYITDKWLKQRGKPQIYGTHSYYKKQNKQVQSASQKVLYPVSNFNNINNVRRTVGFPDSIEESSIKRNFLIPQSYYKKQK